LVQQSIACELPSSHRSGRSPRLGCTGLSAERPSQSESTGGTAECPFRLD
jgi:hypothetical protein